MTSQTDKFIKDQLSVWPEVSARFRALKSAGERRLEAGGLEVEYAVMILANTLNY